jgi:hypothetical protein
MAKKISTLEARIKKIKQDLVSLGDLRPGSLSQQYNVCGNTKCRCKEDPPRKHGPYYQLSFTRKGRSRTKFIKKPHLQTVKEQLNNYVRFRILIDQWIELSTELCQRKLELQTEEPIG